MDSSGTLLIGVGDLGSKLTNDIAKKVKCECFFINKDANNYTTNNIVINIKNILNPSINKIRQAFFSRKDKIIEKSKVYNSIIIIGNLASTFGLAIIPILSKILKSSFRKEIICIVIMPFGFEKEKLFKSGVSLSFLNKFVDSIIMVDNDVFLRSGTDISLKQCFEETNKAIEKIVTFSITNFFPNKFNYLVTDENKSTLTNSFFSAMAMLTDKIDIENVNSAFIYLYNTSEKLTKINNVIETSRNILDKSEHTIHMISKRKESNRFHIVAGIDQDLSCFYDPLKYIIPERNILDFDPEISISIEPISFLRDIESSMSFNTKT